MLAAASHQAHKLHLGRYRQVVTVLVRHGFGFALGHRRLLRHGGNNHDGSKTGHTRPEHLRLALEELGITFIKLGQVLSTRADLLPPEYQAELTRLQDHAPPFPVEDVRVVIEAEFGRPVEALFACFEPEPLATGSIGQAHAATLPGPGGQRVVVKIRRPGAVEQVEEDLAILEALAANVSRHWGPAARYDLIGLVREFAGTLRAELDYMREAHNAERFAENFAGDANVHVPRVEWDRTTERVLTLARIDGIKIDDVEALAAAGIDRPALAERVAHLTLSMVLEDGFFHADPHPGNFFVEPGGRLGVIDFGMVGTVSVETREALVDFAYAVGSGESERVVTSFFELGITGRTDRAALQRSVRALLDTYRGRPLKELALGPILHQLLVLVRNHGLRLPANLALLVKTVIMVEGLGARLDPDFRLTPVLESFATGLIAQRYAPREVLRRLGRAGSETLRLAEELPPSLRRLLRETERGELQIGVRRESLEPLIRRLERLANRLVLGMIVSAFIEGLATLVAVYRPPGWERWAGAAFAAGLMLAAGVGGYLAWVILRSGRA